MSQLLSNAINQTEDAIQVLTHILELTDGLIDAIRTGDAPMIHSILTSRETECMTIAEALNTLDSTLSKLRKPNYPTGDWHTLAGSIRKLEELRETLIVRQSECENLLVSELTKCKNELKALGLSRELKTAYRSPQGPQTSRFVDKKR